MNRSDAFDPCFWSYHDYKFSVSDCSLFCGPGREGETAFVVLELTPSPL